MTQISAFRPIPWLIAASLALFGTFSLSAQIHHGNLWLTTQAQVDAFAYTEITGSLVIHGSSDITNLNGLSSLTTVGEGVGIRFNPSLTSLTGLEGLTHIPQDLWITDNPQLQNLNGLENVTQIGGFLGIDNQAVLANVDGLQGVLTVGKQIAFDRNTSLENIDGLSSLTSIGKWLIIADNPALEHLNGLAALRSVGEFIDIHHNDVLSDFCGLYGLLLEGQVNGTIGIHHNQWNPAPSTILQNCIPAPPASAWKEIGPLISPITEIAHDGNLHLYASSTAGIYRSADMGQSWEFVYANHEWERKEFAMYKGQNPGFAFVNGVPYALWFSHSPFYPEPPYLEAVDGSGFVEILCDNASGDCLEAYDPQDLVQWNNRVLISTGSRGEIWYLDLPNGSWQVVNHAANLLWRNGNELWSAYGGNVSVSSDGGQSWQAYAGGNLPGGASGFAKKGKRVFATVPGHGVFVSFEGGVWAPVTNNLPSLDLVDIALHQQVIHVATRNQGVWKTFNHGQSWKKAAKAGVSNHPISSLESLNGRLFAGGEVGISRRAKGSDDWDLFVRGLSNSSIHWLSAQNNSLIAAKTIGEYAEGSPEFEGWSFRSQSPYDAWQAELSAAARGFDGQQQQGDLVFTWTQGDDYREDYPELLTTYLNGSGPTYVMDFCWDDDEQCQYEFDIRSVAAIGEHLFVLTDNGRIGIADNYGYNDDSEASFVFSLGPASFNRLRVHGGLLYACSPNGLYTSADLGQSWNAAGLQGISVNDLVRGNGYWLALTNGGLYRLMDHQPGNWQSLNVFTYGPKIIFMDQVLYTVFNGEVTYSLDKGDSWQVIAREAWVPAANPYALAVEGNDYLFVGTEGRGIWRHPAISHQSSRLAKAEDSFAKVFPNPTTGYLTLESEFAGEISLWSMDGRLLNQQVIEAGTTGLSLIDQAVGLYVLRLETDHGRENFMVEKR